MPLERFVTQHPAQRFDVAVMINVLEHVPDAVRTLRECKQVLGNPGRNPLYPRTQRLYRDSSSGPGEDSRCPWWIAVPDHINYFNFESLRQLLDRLGFETIYAQGDFPMEMFLLMGENYIGNPKVGSSCHARRVQFDLGVPPELRRKIYSALGQAGVGRDCLVFGKKVG